MCFCPVASVPLCAVGNCNQNCASTGGPCLCQRGEVVPSVQNHFQLELEEPRTCLVPSALREKQDLASRMFQRDSLEEWKEKNPKKQEG